MKKALFQLSVGAVFIFFLLEAIFRLLPVSTATLSGYYIHPLILSYPSRHCFVAATGWDLKNAQHNCTNNLGFLADRDFLKNPQAIALIGDSFVESSMLHPQDRLAAQLERSLAGRPIYSLGGPGSSLLDYAERAKFAAKELGIRTFVFFLERGDVKQALCGSGNIHGPCIDPHTLLPKVETQREPNALKRFLRQSALAQYVFSQLKFDAASVFTWPSKPAARIETNAAEQRLRSEAIERVVQNFFEQLQMIEGARYIFVIDAARDHLFTRDVATSGDLTLFKNATDAFGAVVIDPTADFREFVSRSGMILEVGPYDKHLNAEGMRVLAGAIARRL